MPCWDKTRAGFWLWLFSAGEKRSILFCCSGQNRSTASLALSTVSKGTSECFRVSEGRRVKSVHLSGDFRLSVRGKMEVFFVAEWNNRNGGHSKKKQQQQRSLWQWSEMQSLRLHLVQKRLKWGTNLVSGLVTEYSLCVFFHFLSSYTSVLQMRKH